MSETKYMINSRMEKKSITMNLKRVRFMKILDKSELSRHFAKSFFKSTQQQIVSTAANHISVHATQYMELGFAHRKLYCTEHHIVQFAHIWSLINMRTVLGFADRKLDCS